MHRIDYEHKDPDVARAPDPLVVQPASAVMTVSDTSPLLPG